MTVHSKALLFGNTVKNEGKKTAKLNQKLFFKFATGAIDISRSALHFMLHTINVVAKDGRMYISDFEQLRRTLNFQPKTMERVLTELQTLNLLSWKDGFYYSHFHVLSSGQKSDETYIKNLEIFTSPAVLNLTKNQLRLFLYIASRGLINNATKLVCAETLYKNKHYSGVNYIDSFKQLAAILEVLVSKGLIEVYFNEHFYNSESTNFKEAFSLYCGGSEDTRKKRISKKTKHVIGLRIHPNLTDKVVPNRASRKEIEYFAELNCFFSSHMRTDTIPKFIDIQNELFARFKFAGLELYRKALTSYFATERDNVIYHDLYAEEKTSKAINTMVDFFLLKDITNIIVSTVSETKSNAYFHENLLNLLDYFNEKSSINHKILLEESLEKEGFTLSTLIAKLDEQTPTENGWLLLEKETESIHKLVHYADNVLSNTFRKTVIRQWAKEGLLTQKMNLQALVQQLKEKVIFFRINKPVAATSATTEKIQTTNYSNALPEFDF